MQDLLASNIQSLVKQMIDAHGEKETQRALAKIAGYEDLPPTIQEFLNDPYYLGDVLGSGIYPIWQQALSEIYPTPTFSPYLEVVLTGSIGIGKSTCSLSGVSYDLCKLLYLRDPHVHYKLLKTKKIIFALMNATMGLASGVLYDNLTTWFSMSPFFKLHLGSGPGPMFPKKKLDLITGSRFTHVLGVDVVSAVLSELNFQRNTTTQAYDNYHAVKTRVQSRFMNRGSYPGRMWLDSSVKETGSFVEDVVIKGRESDPTLKVYRYPIWVALAHKGIYSGKTFKLFIGDETKDPAVLDSSDQILIYDESRIIDVPIELESNFRSDLYGSLRDLAGVCTRAYYKLIGAVEKLELALSNKNPFTKEVVVLDFFDNSSLMDYMDFNFIKSDPNPRFIHIDLGISSDMTGIASVRLNGEKTTESFDPISGKPVIQKDPMYYVDFVTYVKAPPGQEVPIYKIKNFLLSLRSRGYPIALITTDGYQSTNLRQDLYLEGFDTDLLSVDRSPAPYVELRNSIYESRLSCVSHSILSRELRELEKRDQKVDHPLNGSKDGADALCGAVYSSRTNSNKYGQTDRFLTFVDSMETSSSDSQKYSWVYGNAEKLILDL